MTMIQTTVTPRRFEFLSSRSFRLGLGVAVSALCLYLALRNVRYADAAAVLSSASLGYVGLALASVALNTVAKALRWQVLIGPRGVGVPFPTVLQALLAGQMLNTLVPARLGDVSRVYAISSRGPESAFVLGTIFLEKLLDMLSYVLLFVVLLLLVRLPAWVGDSVYTLAAITAGVAVLVAVVTYHRHWLSEHLGNGIAWLPQWVNARAGRHLQSGLSSLAVLERVGEVARLVAWSAIVWATAMLNNYLALLALHIHLPVTAALLLLVVLQAGISIPPDSPDKLKLLTERPLN